MEQDEVRIYASVYLVNKDAMSNTWRELSSQSQFLQQLMVQADHRDAKKPD